MVLKTKDQPITKRSRSANVVVIRLPSLRRYQTLVFWYVNIHSKHRLNRNVHIYLFTVRKSSIIGLKSN